MNRRLIKKMLKKRQEFDGFVYSEGNNGGDFIEIENLSNDRIKLKSGHCCIMSIDAIVPTEFLSALLSTTMLKHNNDINKVIESFGWDQKYTNQLKSKVIQTL